MDIQLQKKFETEMVSAGDKKIDIIPVLDVTGDFRELSGKDAIINSVRNLLMCPVGTYPFDPEYGSNFYKNTFDQNDQETMQNIQFDLEDSIRRYIPEVRIDSIDVIKTDEKASAVNLYLIIEDDKNKTVLSLDVQKAAESMFETDDDVYSDTNSIG